MTAPVIPPSPSREEYARDFAAALAANSDESLFDRTEPIGPFIEWLAEARAHEVNDSNAMTLSTVDADGLPDARIVLLKDVDARGFTFYSNRESAKGVELAARPVAALTFHWKSLRRQVRVRGAVEPVTPQEADDYFASRARESRIGAWASKQSRPLEGRFALEKAVAEYTARYAIGDIPRPSYWSGFRIRPLSIEFWHDRKFRLHDRIEFRRETPDAPWSKVRMYP